MRVQIALASCLVVANLMQALGVSASETVAGAMGSLAASGPWSLTRVSGDRADWRIEREAGSTLTVAVTNQTRLTTTGFAWVDGFFSALGLDRRYSQTVRVAQRYGATRFTDNCALRDSACAPATRAVLTRSNDSYWRLRASPDTQDGFVAFVVEPDVDSLAQDVAYLELDLILSLLPCPASKADIALTGPRAGAALRSEFIPMAAALSKRPPDLNRFMSLSQAAYPRLLDVAGLAAGDVGRTALEGCIDKVRENLFQRLSLGVAFTLRLGIAILPFLARQVDEWAGRPPTFLKASYEGQRPPAAQVTPAPVPAAVRTPAPATVRAAATPSPPTTPPRATPALIMPPPSTAPPPRTTPAPAVTPAITASPPTTPPRATPALIMPPPSTAPPPRTTPPPAVTPAITAPTPIAPSSLYSARYTPLVVPTEMRTGGRTTVEFQLTNTGSGVWPASGANAVYFAYRWFRPDRTLVARWDRAGPLGRPMSPNETLKITVEVVAPDAAGTYVLSFEGYDAGKGYFSELGGVPPSQHNVNIKPLTVDIYSAQYTPLIVPTRMQVEEHSTAQLRVTNTSSGVWPAHGYPQVFVFARWLKPDGTEDASGAGADGGHLGEDVYPSGRVQLTIQLIAPQDPGTYVLSFDAYHSENGYFSKRGVPPSNHTVQVGWPQPSPGLTPAPTSVPSASFVVSGRATDAASGQPVAGVHLIFYRSHVLPCCSFVDAAVSDTQGAYSIRLSNGSYWMDSYVDDGRYKREFWLGAADWDTAREIVVSGADVREINVQLRR